MAAVLRTTADLASLALFATMVALWAHVLPHLS